MQEVVPIVKSYGVYTSFSSFILSNLSVIELTNCSEIQTRKGNANLSNSSPHFIS